MKKIIVLLVMVLLQTGMPFSVSHAEEPDYLLQDYLKTCNDLMTESVKNCDEMYDIANEFQARTQCLSDAQEEHEACRKQCQENYGKD